jgi:calcineurin-like phosphoesterase family protein
MSRLFLTSDLHLGHFNIIKYCNRPFKSLQQMDETLIRNWNERIKPEDWVIYLGDFCFKNTSGGKEGEGVNKNHEVYLKQLNGRKTFIRGNHDRNNGFKSHIMNLVLEFSHKLIYCTHRPQDINLDYKINLVGHVHEKWLWKYMYEDYENQTGIKGIMINVGVDQWNFYPVEMQEILSKIAQIERGIIK